MKQPRVDTMVRSYGLFFLSFLVTYLFFFLSIFNLFSPMFSIIFKGTREIFPFFLSFFRLTQTRSHFFAFYTANDQHLFYSISHSLGNLGSLCLKAASGLVWVSANFKCHRISTALIPRHVKHCAPTNLSCPWANLCKRIG